MISFRKSDLIDMINKENKFIGKKLRMVPQDSSKPEVIITGTKANGDFLTNRGVFRGKLNGIRDGYVFVEGDYGWPHIGRKLCLSSGGCLGNITRIKNGIFYTNAGHAIKSEEHGFESYTDGALII